MEYTYDRLRREATEALAATKRVDAAKVNLVTPKPNIPADLAFPVFAVKPEGANPNEFAQRIVGAISLPKSAILGKVEAAGGFVNFAVVPETFARAVVAEVLATGDAYGEDKSVGAGQKVVLEYSSPNIARKMHVGHMRTTVIGHSLYLILKALGYEVIGDNHLGDWGTQFGTLLAALDKWKLTPWDDPDPVQSLVDIYAKFNNAAKEDPALMDLARAWFKRLEDGDAWARQTWQRLIDITMEEFERTYARLNVTFDTQHGESYFEPMLDDLVQEAIAKGVAKVEPGGAVSVNFDDKLPSCLLRKTDGATLYQTRDAATCIYRWREYQPVRNIYVVGAEQKLHFQQVYEIVRRMGYAEIADRSIHIPFGQITSITGGRFSMRQGNVIFLDEVLDEAITRAKAKIEEKIREGKSDLPLSEVDSVAEVVGIGTVIYSDLYQGPDRNIKFDWDQMLSDDGNTSVYIQYTHARCRSILRKADALPPLPILGEGEYLELLVMSEEQAVLKQLYRLPHAVREAGEKFLPAVIADWTYNLAREYARFYHACPVLEAATPQLRQARLALTVAVAQGLKNGLAFLAIGAPEQL